MQQALIRMSGAHVYVGCQGNLLIWLAADPGSYSRCRSRGPEVFVAGPAVCLAIVLLIW